jgi:hypothetical protein
MSKPLSPHDFEKALAWAALVIDAEPLLRKMVGLARKLLDDGRHREHAKIFLYTALKEVPGDPEDINAVLACALVRLAEIDFE